MGVMVHRNAADVDSEASALEDKSTRRNYQSVSRKRPSASFRRQNWPGEHQQKLYHRVARTLNSWSLLATVNQKPSNSYKANQYILLLKSSSSAHVQSDAVHLINFLHAACSTLLYTSVVFVRGILHANILIKNMQPRAHWPLVM